MNKRMYNKYLSTKKITKEQIIDINLDDLFFCEESSQVRQGDTKSSHVANLSKQISARGQEVPITVGPKVTDTESPNFGKRPIRDGNSRWRAKRNNRDGLDLNRLTPSELKEATTIKAWPTSFSSVENLEDFQLDCNEHEAAQSSTQDDYAVVLRRRLENPTNYTKMPKDITWANFGNKPDSFDVLVEWVKSHWKQHGNTAQKIVRAALDGNPTAKIKSYDAKSARREFCGKGSTPPNVFNWVGKSGGEECNGHIPYFLASDSHVFPNLTGNAFLSKTNNHNNKTIAVFWQSNTWGKKESDIRDFRTRALSKVNKATSSHMINSSFKLIDEVVFLPQLKSELGRTLIYAKKKPNGEFQL